MKNILITGATGYLGSHVVHRLTQDDNEPEITVLKRHSSNLNRISGITNKLNLVDLESTKLETLFEEHKFDAVLHFATDYGRDFQKSATEILKSNIIFPLELAELCKRYGVKLFLNTDTLLPDSVSPYALSKKQFREWLISFKSDLIILNVALEQFFGPLDDSSKFVTRVIRSLLNAEPVLPLTIGTQKRDFIFIEDAVDAIIRILESTTEKEKGFYNFEIGTGTLTSVRDFVELAKKLVNNSKTELRFGSVPLRQNEPENIKVNLKAMAEIGWIPKWTLRNALEATISAERSKL